MPWPGRTTVGLGLMLSVMILIAPHATPESRLIELSVRERLLPPDQRTIRVQQGDDVTLRWTTNHALTVHLHGYDIETRLTPGEAATMTFRARVTGRFPITVHSAPGKEAVLGYLEVHPR